VGGVSPKTRKRVGNPRRFYGCEIKPEYIEAAQRNLAKAVAMAREDAKLLF
jgi:predicted O-methyltransferase YrrM